MSVEFIDNTMAVKSLLSERLEQAVEECCGELEAQVKRNQDRYRDTGATTNSWSHRVSFSSMAGEYRGMVGSNMMNAVWEEFGTGEYALNGNGRKGGWFYEDEEGVGHFTYGKHPRRHLHKAYTENKYMLIEHIRDVYAGRK